MSVTAAQDVNYTESTLSAATVVFAIIPIIMVYPWLQKYFAKGAMLGSVKAVKSATIKNKSEKEATYEKGKDIICDSRWNNGAD